MTISNVHVPYSGPDGASILIIGEAPGSDETRLRVPFTGRSGEILRQVLSSSGFNCASPSDVEGNKQADSGFEIKFTNLCSYQPLGGEGFKANEFQQLEDTQQLKDGLLSINNYIQTWKSQIRICITLGAYPLQYICKKYGISKWRGSVITVDGLTILSTYHPSYISRNRSEYPVFAFDIGKAYKIYHHGYQQPKFNFEINPDGVKAEELISEYSNSPKLSVDIETIKDTNRILCIGFARSKSDAFCIVNRSDDGLDGDFRRHCESIFNSPGERIFHNGLFDVEVLHNNHVEVSNFTFDTMVAQHVLAPELAKSLDFITSIYTDIPYYKDRGRTALPDNEKGWGKIKDDDRLNIYEYNCLDCVSTYWCFEEMIKEINEDSNYKHIFNYEMSMHDVAFHIIRSGMLRDNERTAKLKEIVESKYVSDQRILNAITGGYVNVGSPVQKKKLLYIDWGLPEKTGENGKIAADEDAIVSLISHVKDKVHTTITPAKKYEWQKKLAGLMIILKIQGYRKLLGSYIGAEAQWDNRLRSSYKITGTETGRWSCAKYLDDSGFNAQTLPRESLEE